MSVKETLEINNSGPNIQELKECREFGFNNSNILISTFETLYKSPEYVDSRLNNLFERIERKIS